MGKVKNRERHFLSIAALLVVSLTLASCGGNISTSPISMSNADLLKTAASNMKQAKSYHIEVSGGNTGTQLNISGDLDLARNRSKLDIGAAGTTIAAITISGTTYASSDGGKTYIPTNASLTSAVNGFTALWTNFNPQQADKATLNNGNPPSEAIDGQQCRHISASTTDLASLSNVGGSSMDGTVDIWVATDGANVCQIRLTGSSGGQQGDITIKWSSINGNFDIQAPPQS